MCLNKLHMEEKMIKNHKVEDEMYRLAVELKKLQSYHWTKAYTIGEIDYWKE